MHGLHHGGHIQAKNIALYPQSLEVRPFVGELLFTCIFFMDAGPYRFESENQLQIYKCRSSVSKTQKSIRVSKHYFFYYDTTKEIEWTRIQLLTETSHFILTMNI